MEVDGGVYIVVQFFEIFPTPLIVTNVIMRRLGDAIGIRCGLSNWMPDCFIKYLGGPGMYGPLWGVQHVMCFLLRDNTFTSYTPRYG